MYNPLGGRMRRRKNALREALTEIPGIIRREASNSTEITSALTTLINGNIDLLIIAGGDGTVQAVLGHLFANCPADDWPILTVVPGGTTNMTAADLGIHSRPERVTQRLHDLLLQPATPLLLQRHVLCIEQQGQAPVYGMFFGAGLIARGVKYSRSRIKRLGIPGGIFSAIIILRSLGGFILGRGKGGWAPADLSINDMNGGVRSGSYQFAFASTLNRLIYGMHPYWGREPGPIHVTLVEQRRRYFWRKLVPLLYGRGKRLEARHGYHSYNTHALEIAMDDDYIVDGELYRADGKSGPLRISATLPVTFLIP